MRHKSFRQKLPRGRADGMRRGYSAERLRVPEQAMFEPDAGMIAALQNRILHHDAHVLVLDKPAGLAVHPGPRTTESLEAYLPHLCLERSKAPQPAHRLDRDTSGCLALGRTPGAVRNLAAAFSEGAVQKVYWAIVVGHPNEKSGTIDAPLLKTSSPTGGWKMQVARSGKPARTHWKILASQTDEQERVLTWLELTPETGRTHQIRIHCAHAGFPLLGDPVYGMADEKYRTMLHAASLNLPIQGGARLHVAAPLPHDWPALFAGVLP